ncbi:MAG: hypothetical protein ACKV0T_29210 [Planctomycetales bacterium]
MSRSPKPAGVFAAVVNFSSIVRQLERPTGLAGFYNAGNQLAKVLQSGSRLTFVNGAGERVEGHIAHGTNIEVPSLSLTGRFNRDDGTLTFSNGTVWTKVRQIAGHWLTNSDRVAGILQLRTEFHPVFATTYSPTRVSGGMCDKNEGRNLASKDSWRLAHL